MIKYTITNASNWDTYSVKMAEALGHNNIQPRYSLDNSLVLMKLDEDNLPDGFVDTLYTQEEIRSELDTLAWTPEPSEGGIL